MKIFFYEEGRNWRGLEWAVKSINRFNSQLNPILISDTPKSLCIDVSLNDFIFNKSFKKIFKHKHPEHSEEFVLRAINRWLSIYEYCHVYNIDGFIATPDSDVLFFCDLEEVQKTLPENYSYYCSFPGEHKQCPTFIRNHQKLGEFVKWVFEFYYKKRYDNYPEITDMFLWYLFFEETSQRIYDLSQVVDNKTFDHHLCCEYGGFEFKNGSRKIKFRNHIPYGFQNGMPVRFNSLHCWGPWKDKIGNIFNGQYD